MDNIINTLEQVAELFKNMTPEEYNALYVKALDNVKRTCNAIRENREIK
jgi:hypothetical protein